MGWIIAIIVGGIAGWLASKVMNRDASMGIMWNVVAGCVGSVVG
ncbi:GlsB/YeaQ/YmgE family stress response membrane protein, partial [Sphingorhabdus sp.]